MKAFRIIPLCLLLTATCCLLLFDAKVRETQESISSDEICLAPPIDQDKLEELREEFRRLHPPQIGIRSLAVPAYSSRPGAAKTLYLDFDGDPAVTWYFTNVPIQPAYDRDGTQSSFSAAELTSIQEIWSRVSECFSGYDLNVTTVEPAELVAGISGKVVIAGNGSWYGSAGGVAYLHSFTSAFLPRWSYVFPSMLGNGHPKYVSDATCHEAGHMFGLSHQSLYTSPTPIAYNPGGGGRAPIMGNSYSQARPLWWNGTSTSASNFQNDPSRLLTPLPASPDEAPSTTSGATSITLSSNSFAVTGVLQLISDIDTYELTLPVPGALSVAVDPHSLLKMADLVLSILDSDGSPLAHHSPIDLYSAGASLDVTAGNYYVVISSAGAEVGDFGSYTITGSLDPSGTPAPTSTPTRTPTQTPTATRTPTATQTPSPTIFVDPAPQPTAVPTSTPTSLPTFIPSPLPSAIPTESSVDLPEVVPTEISQPIPTQTPTVHPSTPALRILAPKNRSLVSSANAKLALGINSEITHLRIQGTGVNRLLRTPRGKNIVNIKVPLTRSKNLFKISARKNNKELARKQLTVLRK